MRLDFEGLYQSMKNKGNRKISIDNTIRKSLQRRCGEYLRNICDALCHAETTSCYDDQVAALHCINGFYDFLVAAGLAKANLQYLTQKLEECVCITNSL